MDTLPRRDALVLLAVLGVGVFLAGMELMITAVALPAIVVDLADWTRLREASWIINGYLLVYVVTMPLAGRLADLWGNRRLFLGALALFTRRVASSPAWRRRSSCSIAARLVQAAGGGILVPVATSAASHLFTGALAAAGPGRHRRAHVPRDGRRGRSSARRSSARSTRRRRCRAWASLPAGRSPARSRPRGAGCSTSTSRSAIIVLALVVGRERRLGDAASRGPRGHRGRRDLLAVPRRRRSARSRCSAHAPDAAGGGLDPAVARRRCWRRSASLALVVTVVRGLRVRDPFLDPRLFRSRLVLVGDARLRAHRATASRPRSSAAAVYVDRVLYGGPDEQRLALGRARGGDGRRRARIGVPRARCCGCGS